MKDQGIIKSDISFLVKKLDNQIQRKIYGLYNRREFQECSLLNMWVTDFLYDMQQLEKPVFQKDIEAEFSVNRATASKMLSLMEKKKLIRRTSCASDSRMKQIQLEARGLELQKLCRYIQEELERQLTSCLTEEEIKVFKELCLRMLSEM